MSYHERRDRHEKKSRCGCNLVSNEKSGDKCNQCKIKCYTKTIQFSGKDIGTDEVLGIKSVSSPTISLLNIKVTKWINSNGKIVGFEYSGDNSTSIPAIQQLLVPTKVECFIVKTCTREYTSNPRSLSENRWVLPEYYFGTTTDEEIVEVTFIVSRGPQLP